MTPNPWEGSSSSASHEILALYGGWRFIIVFTTAINWPCPEPMYLVHVLPLYLRYISILSSHPNLDHWSTLSFGFPHTCHTTRPSQPPWLHQPNNMRWAVQAITFIIQLSAVCWYLHSVRPKLCPQVTWGQKNTEKLMDACLQIFSANGPQTKSTVFYVRTYMRYHFIIKTTFQEIILNKIE